MPTITLNVYNLTCEKTEILRLDKDQIQFMLTPTNIPII